jgi:hypothetical protein
MPHRPEPHRAGQRPDGLLLTIVARWARMATLRPWRYAATWAIGIGAANLTPRTALNTLPAWRKLRRSVERDRRTDRLLRGHVEPPTRPGPARLLAGWEGPYGSAWTDFRP